MGRIATKKVNSGFFKKWNRNMAYMLGYIVADGCVYKRKDRKNGYYLNITSKDKAHLIKLNKALGSTFSICNKHSSNGSLIHQFQIRDKRIFDDLIKLGVNPKKTYDINFSIKIPSKYFMDFTRGFFDGDGSVYVYLVNKSFQIKANFSSNSFVFTKYLNENICKYLKTPLKTIHEKTEKDRLTRYHINFYIDDCKRLAKSMYKNNPSLYLERKYEVFKKWESINRRKYEKKNYPSKVGWKLNQSYYINRGD